MLLHHFASLLRVAVSRVVEEVWYRSDGIYFIDMAKVYFCYSYSCKSLPFAIQAQLLHPFQLMSQEEQPLSHVRHPDVKGSAAA